MESYIYSVKNTIEDEKVKDKITDEDKNTVNNLVKEVQEWLDIDTHSTQDYKEKKSELEKSCVPILSKIYSNESVPDTNTNTNTNIEDID